MLDDNYKKLNQSWIEHCKNGLYPWRYKNGDYFELGCGKYCFLLPNYLWEETNFAEIKLEKPDVHRSMDFSLLAKILWQI